MEVDASEVGVGAVLSQRSFSDEKIHPCSFFSHRLTLTERNYDIGNRELLAVKLALEEWRHWLEGAGFPFIVWTDHKNLEYTRTAKGINFRQAHWALVFGRFRFTISYRPGSKNGKPDALSRIFEAKASPTPLWQSLTRTGCGGGSLGGGVQGPRRATRHHFSRGLPRE